MCIRDSPQHQVAAEEHSPSTLSASQVKQLARIRNKWSQMDLDQSGALDGDELLHLADWAMHTMVAEGEKPIGEADRIATVSYTHLRAHETPEHLVCRLLLEKKK
eukprot:TRINITY_DN31682_c0_g1_i1.p2 TRINITY_DN31682_c0_g1~~TRINITY_DN31682_c0_g1_i1.p2  ORF type:complete len:105 (-),score=37.87 TRINITY_DN31682_c0_g1_i1:69-383(-)